MQRCFQAKWTQDSKYLLTGSDDGNVRLWRANASSREGIKSTRQRQALEYNEALSKRYEHMVSPLPSPLSSFHIPQKATPLIHHHSPRSDASSAIGTCPR